MVESKRARLMISISNFWKEDSPEAIFGKAETADVPLLPETPIYDIEQHVVISCKRSSKEEQKQ